MSEDLELYTRLGIDKNADIDEIKKAFRKKAIKHHPDKGGKEDDFKKIKEAYEILGDKDKRAKYDLYGMSSVTDNISNATTDIFENFFGVQQRTKDTIIQVNIKLEDLYNGKNIKYAISRKIRDGSTTCCSLCKGSGTISYVKQMGRMIQQVRTTCSRCNGQGATVCFKTEKNTVEVYIQPGTGDNERICLPNMGDENISGEFGNIILIIKEKEHELFKRSKNDLIINKKITLYQALTGVKFSCNHMDGRKLNIQTPNNRVIESGSIFRISEEGMPSKLSSKNGDLLIKFLIIMPKNITEEQKFLLSQMFPDESGLSAVDNTDELFYLAMPELINSNSLSNENSEEEAFVDNDTCESSQTCNQS
tara:strand:+ start:11768 stop:12859 length:1092 start_codon:yes stop_codon:yes gene_type:complete